MKKKYILIGLAFAAAAGIGLYVSHFELRGPVFEVYFFKLNRGRSIFLKTPGGRTLLIDGGQNSEVVRELTKVLPFYRRRIDIIIATRGDPKNVGGLVDVLKRYEVGKIYEPIVIGTSTALFAFEKVAKEKGIHIEKLSKGDDFALDSVQFKTIFPDPSFKFNKSNIPELALEVAFKETKLFFLGDLSAHIQKILAPELGPAYLVEFAHGATKSRVSADLLSKITPTVIVSTKREETEYFRFK